MKKIFKLYEDLNRIKERRKKVLYEDMSVIEFIKCKRLISKENIIKKKINNINSLKEKVQNDYLNFTTKWINDSNIKCMKYSRLEKAARYKRDRVLYKLGFYKVHPLMSFIKGHSVYKCFYSKIQKFNFFKKFKIKVKKFISIVLPQKINKMAVDVTQKCIKGYRSFKDDVGVYKKFIKNKSKTYKYLSNIKEQAIQQLDENSLHNEYINSLKIENFKSNISQNNKVVRHISVTKNSEKQIDISNNENDSPINYIYDSGESPRNIYSYKRRKENKPITVSSRM